VKLAYGKDQWEGGRVASDGEMRDGVSLTNLDQPLFEGAGATKRDLVDYLDAVADKIIAELRDRPLSVVRVRPGQGAVHAEERAQVHPAVGADRVTMGREFPARGVLRAVRRPSHAAVVRFHNSGQGRIAAAVRDLDL
jgi:hypothetical protein